MNAIAGAIVVLAGAVLVGAGAMTDAILAVANRSGSGAGISAIVAGFFIGLLGLILLFIAPREQRLP